jgi:hypothetical protein
MIRPPGIENGAFVVTSTMIYGNGDLYTGEWECGTQHGTGIYESRHAGIEIFRGCFNEGRRNGRGEVWAAPAPPGAPSRLPPPPPPGHTPAAKSFDCALVPTLETYDDHDPENGNY